MGARLAFAKGLCTPSPTDASNYCKQTYLVVDISLYLVGYLRAVHTRRALQAARCMHIACMWVFVLWLRNSTWYCVATLEPVCSSSTKGMSDGLLV